MSYWDFVFHPGKLWIMLVPDGVINFMSLNITSYLNCNKTSNLNCKDIKIWPWPDNSIRSDSMSFVREKSKNERDISLKIIIV
jgi:hypothetical protein